MAIGNIDAIRGVVVDVNFPEGDMPEIYEALELDGPDGTLVLEVQQHLGEGVVRTVAMGSTDGLQRGIQVRDERNPVGDSVEHIAGVAAGDIRVDHRRYPVSPGAANQAVRGLSVGSRERPVAEHDGVSVKRRGTVGVHLYSLRCRSFSPEAVCRARARINAGP